MAREVLDISEAGVRRLFAEMILQAVNDYLRLKKAGRIKDGWPVGNTAYRKDSDWSASRQLCEFFWSGWMEKLVAIGGLQVFPSSVYKRLEPRLWRNLISVPRKG